MSEVRIIFCYCAMILSVQKDSRMLRPKFFRWFNKDVEPDPKRTDLEELQLLCL